MKNGKLWEVFDQLTTKELQEVEKCVQSPWFNNRPSVVKLFHFLVECRNELKIVPTKEQVHFRVFGDKNYEDIRVRNALSFLLKIIERFFALQELERAGNDSKLALATVYRKRQLNKHYDQAIRGGETLLKNQPFRNADYYNSQYRLEFERYRALSAQRSLKSMNLQVISDNLDIAYLAQKLRQTCLSISHQTVYSTEYDFGLLPLLLEAVQRPAYQSIPAISVYYHCYFFLTEPEEESHFQNFKKILVEHRAQFPLRELSDLYLYATNYCIQRMNKNAQQYAGEALDFYKEGLIDDVLLPDGILPHITFSNIVTMSLVTEDYEFAEEFIENYRKSLAPEYRKSIYSFNLARLLYQRKEFDEALPLLQSEVYRDLLLNLLTKTLTAKIFFESGEYDVLYSHLDAMQQFIRRKKVMGYHQDNFQNFISFLKRIIEIPDFEKENRRDLKRDIEEVKAVAERRWLLEQV